MTHIGNQY